MSEPDAVTWCFCHFNILKFLLLTDTRSRLPVWQIDAGRHFTCLQSQWCHLPLCDILCCLRTLWFSLWTSSLTSPCFLHMQHNICWLFVVRLWLWKDICILWFDILILSSLTTFCIPVNEWAQVLNCPYPSDVDMINMIPAQDSVPLWKMPGCYFM